jgi:hypothetical protein
MPSPRRTNKANAWIVPMKIDRRTAMALDQGNRHDEFAATRADLSDLAKRREVGDQEQERSGLLETLESGHGSRRPGEGFNLDEEIDAIARSLRRKGIGEDDIRRACDAARKVFDQELGVGRSARFGGNLGGSNFGGNLHSQVEQPNVRPLGDPGAKDFMTYEEMTGCEPARGRGDSRFGRDSLMGFDQVYGLLPTIEKVEAQRPHRRSDRQLGMDARATESFYERFPNARRIGAA